jgi:hypothetical protein
MNCAGCAGSGRRTYGSTATWRGGIGGQAITVDTCNRCWGSGDSAAPGENQRHAEIKASEAYRQRLAADPAFRWKQRARMFARRARNHRLNYRELQKEIHRLHQKIRSA